MQNRPMLMRHNCLQSIKNSELIVLKNFLIAKSNMIPFIVSLKYPLEQRLNLALFLLLSAFSQIICKLLEE